MRSIKFIVKTKSKSYPIYFGNGILSTTGSLIKKNLVGVKKMWGSKRQHYSKIDTASFRFLPTVRAI